MTLALQHVLFLGLTGDKGETEAKAGGRHCRGQVWQAVSGEHDFL